MRYMFLIAISIISLFESCDKQKIQKNAIVTSTVNDSTILSLIAPASNIENNDCEKHAFDYSAEYCKRYHAHWKAPDEIIRTMNFLNGELKTDSLYLHIMEGARRYTRDSFTVLFSSVPPSFDCPPCAPAVGIADFVRRKDTLITDTVLYAVINAGSMGTDPVVTELSIGNNKAGYVFDWTIVGQGYTESGITVIGKHNDSYDTLLQIVTDRGNEGMCDDSIQRCWSYHYDYAFMKDSIDRYGFYPLKISCPGTRMADTTVAACDSVKYYRFDGRSRYVESKE